jgi:hypothetical protein
VRVGKNEGLSPGEVCVRARTQRKPSLKISCLFPEKFGRQLFKPTSGGLFPIDDPVDLVVRIDFVDFKVLNPQLLVFSHGQNLHLFEHSPTSLRIWTRQPCHRHLF